MTKVFRILQLKGLGLPQGEIASSCAVSRSTVSKVLKKHLNQGLPCLSVPPLRRNKSLSSSYSHKKKQSLFLLGLIEFYQISTTFVKS